MRRSTTKIVFVAGILIQGVSVAVSANTEAINAPDHFIHTVATSSSCQHKNKQLDLQSPKNNPRILTDKNFLNTISHSGKPKVHLLPSERSDSKIQKYVKD